MAKTVNKTQATDADVEKFLAAVPDPGRREDCQRIRELMEAATGAPARLWGPSIVGFGVYHYRYESGREGDWMVTGFSPRKNDLTLYIMPGFARYEALMARLGKHKTGKSCLYIKRLADVDMAVLETLVRESVAAMAPQRTDVPAPG
ncbi:hypothetical protein GCM10011521_15620 [Arenimonas soli]|uniref:YdhG-like domain-containing protein n=1 Tax=Arenimonas soli TaxID=2269504 RepID=A0ABQ1HJ01_9GAMM|nr:DUF1801 domain-containing protein [Arenimonas soli]GGA78128.1 hypothetical protein GCM10011521_15620 [Arenimonas soli]